MIKQTLEQLVAALEPALYSLEKEGVYKVAPFFGLDSFKVKQPYLYIRYNVVSNTFEFEGYYEAAGMQSKRFFDTPTAISVKLNPLMTMNGLSAFRAKIPATVLEYASNYEITETLCRLQRFIHSLSFAEFFDRNAVTNLLCYRAHLIPPAIFFKNLSHFLTTTDSFYSLIDVREIFEDIINATDYEGFVGNPVRITFDDSLRLSKNFSIASKDTSMKVPGQPLMVFATLTKINDEKRLVFSAGVPAQSCRSDFYWKVGSPIPIRDFLEVFSRKPIQANLNELSDTLEVIRIKNKEDNYDRDAFEHTDTFRRYTELKTTISKTFSTYMMTKFAEIEARKGVQNER